jgi:opacity protein-like surface antigen
LTSAALELPYDHALPMQGVFVSVREKCMRRGVSGCAATAFVLFVSLGCEIAAASESTETKERGFYLGASASRVEQEPQGEGAILVAAGRPPSFLIRLTPTQVDVDDTDTGWNVTLGYRINKYLAAEVAYYDFGEASVIERYSTDGFPGPLNVAVRSSVEAYGPGVSLLGTLPLTAAIELFARGGVLFLDQEIEKQSASLRSSRRTGEEIWMAGAGVQWSFASRWATRLEYQLTDDIDRGGNTLLSEAGTTGIEQLSLGVLFDF